MTQPRYAGRTWSRRLLITAAVLCASGCGTSVTISTDFPPPLIEPLPVRVGLLLDDELQQFEHYEAIPRQSKWTIRLGNANVAFLTPLFENMFIATEHVTESTLAQALRNLDGVIRPSLQAFEFEVPSSANRRDQFVEVWMQYNLELFGPNGELVIDWPVSGYGRTALSRGAERSVNRAATIAMRDVGAAITTRFAQQPQVTHWLEERRNEAALPVGARLAP
jgi:hypothetical protein